MAESVGLLLPYEDLARPTALLRWFNTHLDNLTRYLR